MKKTLDLIRYQIPIIIILYGTFSPFFKTNKFGTIMILSLIVFGGLNLSFNKKQIWEKNNKVNKKIIIFILLIFIQMCFQVYLGKNILKNKGLIIRLISISVYMTSINFNYFWKKSEAIVFFLISVSLVGYFFRNYSNLFAEYFLKKIILRDRVYNNFYYLYGYFESRYNQNSGFTWEPSIFSILIGIFLFVYCVSNPSLSPKIDLKKYVYILAIITTKSTTGFGILFIIILYLIYKNLNIKTIILSVLILVLAVNNPEIQKIVYKKLKNMNSYTQIKKSKNGEKSSVAREMHLKIDMKIFKDNVVMGNSDMTENMRKKYAYKLSTLEKKIKIIISTTKEHAISSNALSYTLASHGIIIFFYWLYLAFRNTLFSKKIESIIYGIILFIAFYAQEANWLPFFITLWFQTPNFFNIIKKEKGEYR